MDANDRQDDDGLNRPLTHSKAVASQDGVETFTELASASSGETLALSTGMTDADRSARRIADRADKDARESSFERFRIQPSMVQAIGLSFDIDRPAALPKQSNHLEIPRKRLAGFAKSKPYETAFLQLHPKLDPHVITLLMAAVGMLIAREDELGVSFGHKETEAAVEAVLAAFETERPSDENEPG